MFRKIFAAAAAVVCAGMVSAQSKLKIATIAPANSPWERAQDDIAASVYKATNGSLSVTFVPMNTQGGEVGVIKRMKMARPGQTPPIDGAVFTSIGINELLPDIPLLTLVVPGLFQSQDELNYALEKVAESLESDVAKAGYILLGWMNVGWSTFFSTEEIRTVEKLKSLKLDPGGFGSDALSNLFKAAGYNVEAVPSGQLLKSVQSPNGIRCAYSVPMLAFLQGWQKSLPYVLDIPVCPVMCAVVVSKSSWDKLNSQAQSAVKKAFLDAQRSAGREQEKTDREYLDRLEKDGAHMVRLSAAEKQAMQAEFDSDVRKMAAIPKSPMSLSFYEKLKGYALEHRNGEIK